jgi:polysaccharide chain length determinant protein (PEP-CTERM system associated)
LSGAGKDSLGSVWARRRWLAILVGAVAFAAALCFALSLPDFYRATATLLVERPDPPSMWNAPGEMETRLHAMSQQILSRPRLAELVRRFGLYPDLTGRASLEAITDQMQRDIQVEMKGFQPSPGSRGPTTAFTVSYRGSDPVKVAEVTNALAELYVEADKQERRQNVEVLRGQLEEMKGRLDEQERRLSGVRSGGDLPQQLALTMATLDRLNSQLRLDTDARIRAMERRVALVKQLAETDPQGAGEPDAAAARLAKLNRDLAQLRLRYSDKYPDVIRLKEEIVVLERRIAEGKAEPAATAEPAVPSVQRLRDALREAEQEIKTLRDEEGRLRAEIADYYRRIEGAPAQEKEFQRLSRDDQTTRDLYNALLKRFEEAQLKAGSDPSEGLRILDPAPVPKDPVAPDRFRLIFMALAVSIALAVAAALFAEQVDASFHTVDDLRTFTRVPVLASIPRIETRGDERRRRRRRAAAAVSIIVGLSIILGGARELARGNEQMVRLLAKGRS